MTRRDAFRWLAGMVAIVATPFARAESVRERFLRVHAEIARDHLEDATVPGLIAWLEKNFDCKQGWPCSYHIEGITQEEWFRIADRYPTWYGTWQHALQERPDLEKHVYQTFQLGYVNVDDETDLRLDEALVRSLHWMFVQALEQRPSARGARSYWRYEGKIKLEDAVAYPEGVNEEVIPLRNIRSRVSVPLLDDVLAQYATPEAEPIRLLNA